MQTLSILKGRLIIGRIMPLKHTRKHIKVGWLCLPSHRQRGHLETAPPFTVPCKGRKGRFYAVPTGNRTPGRCVVVHYTTDAPRHASSTHIKEHDEKNPEVVVYTLPKERHKQQDYVVYYVIVLVLLKITVDYNKRGWWVLRYTSNHSLLRSHVLRITSRAVNGHADFSSTVLHLTNLLDRNPTYLFWLWILIIHNYFLSPADEDKLSTMVCLNLHWWWWGKK